MNRVSVISTYTHQLVAQIEQHLGRPLLPALRDAFFQVPRHRFLEQYYDHRQRKTPPASSDQLAWEEWLGAIYQDQALTTRIDARGLPLSSSSQPSVMAVMWEALALRPGMRVLEIGTGTGYNAALGAVLAGDPHHVSSVDIDPTLIDSARTRIEQVVGTGMTIQVHNGFEGYEPEAPYDRILATASAFPVPWPWIDQLRGGGKLIMDLRGRLAGGLMLLEKDEQGTATGRFLSGWNSISFMGLRSSVNEQVHLPLPQGYQLSPLQETFQLSPHDQGYECAMHFSTYEHMHAQDEEVNLWVQCAIPGMSITWKGAPGALAAFLTDTRTHTVVMVEPRGKEGKAITVRGERPLWSEILKVYQQWLHRGRPGRESFVLSIDQQHQLMRRRDEQEGIGPFLLAQRQD